MLFTSGFNNTARVREPQVSGQASRYRSTIRQEDETTIKLSNLSE
jgi:hypothetical protein